MSTTVIEQLSRLRITSRSSSSAAPITALMAMKWLAITSSSPRSPSSTTVDTTWSR
ncbi:MAG: hypothetical protein R2705_20230 [Ilumatobacteraceae bacterium]